MEDKTIQTERLTLVLLNQNHLEAYHAVCSDHGASSWNLTGRRETIEDSKNYFARELRGTARGQRSWMVHVSDQLEQKDCIGLVHFRPNRRVGQDGFVTWELGYSLRGEYWGKGYATEAVTAAVDELRKEFTSPPDAGDATQKAAAKLVAWVGPANGPSLRVLKKVGFEIVRLLQFGGKQWWLGGAWVADEVYILERLL